MNQVDVSVKSTKLEFRRVDVYLPALNQCLVVKRPLRIESLSQVLILVNSFTVLVKLRLLLAHFFLIF